MLRFDKVIKPWKEAASLNDHINLYGFWNESAFLTKSGDLGMVLRVPGVDYESLDHDEQEYAVKRLEAALKAFGPGFHIYQYFFRENRPEIPFANYDDPVVAAAIDQRRQFFEAKRDHLYHVEIFYCILLEGARSKTGVGAAFARLFHDPAGAIGELKTQFTSGSMKSLLRSQIEQDLARLEQRVQAFIRQLADFMLIEVLNQPGQFRFFRRLLNYDEWRIAGSPQHTQFLDYQVVNSNIGAERDHLHVGDHFVRVLTMKEAITETRPLVLDALLKIPASFIGEFAGVFTNAEAGRPFEQLQEAGMRTATLDQIVRQKDPSLKSAVELLATGQTTAALDLLQQQGRIREIGDPLERIRTIARTYAESPANTLIVSPDNASRRQLNLAVREELKANGALSKEDHSLRVLMPRQDMTGADRAWANHYEIGDVIRYGRGSKSTGIYGSSYGTVAAINPSANLLSVELASGELATYDPRRLIGVSVYREVALEFSVGDRIQFTAPDKQLGVANRDLAVIESIAPEARIVARLDDRQFEFNFTEHRHFDHGYAVTSHSSQGLTAERILIHADSGVHPELLNSRFGYVSVSRASHEATVFTDDTAKMGQRFGAEFSKTSALEIGQATFVSQGLGIT